jgi:hypothetical protein
VGKKAKRKPERRGSEKMLGRGDGGGMRNGREIFSCRPKSILDQAKVQEFWHTLGLR